MATGHALAAVPSDIDASRYADAIRDLVERGIVEGYPDGTFKPQQTVNRAELLTILLRNSIRAEETQTQRRRRCFADVAQRAWYFDVVCGAKERGIVTGEKGNYFHPERTVNYAEALKITMKALDVPVDASTSGEAWYETYVASAHEHGIVSRHAFLPWQNVTRERMADIVKRALDYKEHPGRSSDNARLSRGCTASAPSNPPSSVTARGVARDIITYVPADYRAEEPRGLIVAFHGRTNSAREVRGYLELERYGREYIIVYPQALTNGGGTYHWANAGDPKDDLRDFALFDAVTKEIGDMYCINENEIFVVGYSLGAWFANAVACARSDVVRGMASLGGSSPYMECDAPVAAMILHNPKDTLASVLGGEQARDMFLRANACDGTPPVAQHPEHLRCVRHSCAADPVLWCPHTVDEAWWDKSYYPHVWPRGTAEHILQFFRSLPT